MTKAVARYTKEALASVQDLGPAMRALTDKQRGFVMAMFDLGDSPTYTDCARAAGYEAKEETSFRVIGHQLAHSEKIQLAIKEEADRRVIGMVPLATKRLHQLLLDRTEKDHFSAVKHTQALTGQSPKQVHVVEHIHDRSAMIQEIKGSLALLKHLGIAVGADLVPPDATDAEFEEVDPESSTEGLEDLL